MVVVVPGKNSSVFRALHEALWQYPNKILSRNVLEASYKEADRATEWSICWSVALALESSVCRIVCWDELEDIHPELHNFLKRVDMREILRRVFGELQPCRMEFYSESAGEVFQSEPQVCGSATYFYVFELDDDPEPCFTVDLWYSREGFLMSPRLEALSKVFGTEEDATNVKANGAAWAAQNL